MVKNLETVYGRLTSTVLLAVEGKKEKYYTSCENVKRAGERLLRMTEMLPDGFLGWQIATDEEKNTVTYAFSSPGLKVQPEDYDWIFQKCAKVSGMHSEALESLFEENRKVYQLALDPECMIDKNQIIEECSNFYYYDGEEPSTSLFFEMFSMFLEAGAVIRFAVSANGKNRDHGMILVSLPAEMTLRMYTMIALAFPHMEAREIENMPETWKKVEYLPNQLLLACMERFLYTLRYREEKVADPWEIMETDEPGETGSNKPAWEEEAEEKSFAPGNEDEEWLVDSYNTFQPADIKTAAEARAMSEAARGTATDDAIKTGEEDGSKQNAERPRMSAVLAKTTSSMDQLDELIGLADVKKQVRKIAAYARMKQDLMAHHKEISSVSLNMVFVGNPGTAKTTVARILAGIFYEIGLVSSGELVEVGRAELVAYYEGQTAGKVKKVFHSARGKCLFIDEAYSLYDSKEGNYGDEAISTLISEMENNRDDTIVILAGYPGKMEKLFATNPGLRSRVPFCLRFKDYSLDEMLEIVELEARKRCFSINAEAREKIRDICK